jgi:hypothetical protein
MFIFIRTDLLFAETVNKEKPENQFRLSFFWGGYTAVASNFCAIVIF